MNRIWKYAKAGLRWYLSPSGLLFGFSIALLGAGLLPIESDWAFTLAGLVLLAIFVPYRLDRQQARGDRQIKLLQGRQAKAQGQLGQVRTKTTEIARLAGAGFDRAARADASAERAGQAARQAAEGTDHARRDLAQRVAMSERALGDRMAEYRSESRGQLQSMATGLQKLIDELADRLATQLKAGDQRLADEDKRLVEVIDSLADGVAEARSSLTAAIANERSQRIVGFARRDSDHKMPSRVALIVAVPRTGSTWSFDMLRTAPSVFVEPSLLIWEQLGLRGRRYPAGLSDSPSASIDVEVAPGVGAEIDTLIANEETTPTIAVEKLHPEFFGFSPQTLDHAIERMESSDSPTTVVPIYQVRNPVEVLWSFARYKQRDAAWYRQISMEEVPAFVRRTFETIEELIALRPGFVVDFRDLYEDQTVADLFSYTDPTVDSAQVNDLVERARLATRRDVRLKQQSRPFLADRMASSSVDVSGPDGAWTAVQDDVAACHEIYERLLAHRGKGTSAGTT